MKNKKVTAALLTAVFTGVLFTGCDNPVIDKATGGSGKTIQISEETYSEFNDVQTTTEVTSEIAETTIETTESITETEVKETTLEDLISAKDIRQSEANTLYACQSVYSNVHLKIDKNVIQYYITLKPSVDIGSVENNLNSIAGDTLLSAFENAYGIRPEKIAYTFYGEKNAKVLEYEYK